jgi:hypothetical protein
LVGAADSFTSSFAGVDGGALDALCVGPLNAFTPDDPLIARLFDA